MGKQYIGAFVGRQLKKWHDRQPDVPGIPTGAALSLGFCNKIPERQGKGWHA